MLLFFYTFFVIYYLFFYVYYFLIVYNLSAVYGDIPLRRKVIL